MCNTVARKKQGECYCGTDNSTNNTKYNDKSNSSDDKTSLVQVKYFLSLSISTKALCKCFVSLRAFMHRYDSSLYKEQGAEGIQNMSGVYLIGLIL